MEFEDILPILEEIQNQQKTYKPVKNNSKTNISVLNSLELNWKSHLILILAVYLLSKKTVLGFLKGYFTLNVSYVLWYFVHLAAHIIDDHFPIPFIGCFHDYHHKNDNLLGLFIEVVVAELGFISWWLLLYWSLFDNKMNFIDPWIIVFYAFMYVTIHNINYSILKVNQTHYRHHLTPLKNVGPDICDIIFGSKADGDDEIENTDHYIPNAICITIFLLALKEYFANSKSLLFWICYLFCIFNLIVGFIFYFVYYYFKISK